MQSKNLETEINESLVGLRSIALVPTVQCDPVSKLGAAVLALDHETGHADKTAAPGLDDCESGGASGLPRRRVSENPLGCGAMRVRMRNRQRRVSDLAHASQSLNIERVVGDEWTKGQALRRESGLVWHEKENKEKKTTGWGLWAERPGASATIYLVES